MNPESFDFHTKPFAHQDAIFRETAELRGYALFWEQGVGKTKPTIDTAAYLFEAGKINALVIVAPSGVHRNWYTDEVPTHMPPRVRVLATELLWDTSKAGNVGFKQEAEDLLTCHGLAVLYISYDAFVTKTAVAYLGRFFRKRRVFFVADEGHYLKTPGTTRSRTVRTAAKHAEYRRLLTGTPVGKGPFDVYAQVHFVEPTFWASNGFDSYAAFKAYFGDFLPRGWVKKNLGFDPGFDGLLKGYKNLDELNTLLAKVGHRLTKEGAGLNLPPKLYRKHYFDLAPGQRKVYDALRRDLEVDLSTGETITAVFPITNLLRLQQISCGYVGTGDEEKPLVELEGPNPRLSAAEEIRDGLHRPTIWWSRFSRDIDKLMDLLGKGAVRYDGQVDEDGRARAKEAFQKGEAQHFVGNPAAGATGLTLVQAKHTVYYSNSFKLVDRLQSEDRNHRIGQHDPVDYTDIIGTDTVDGQIVSALRSNFDIASQITGDRLREWI